MPALSAADLLLLQGIPPGQTRTVNGAARNEACRNFALTGGITNGGDWVAYQFGLVNLGRGDDNPLVAAIRAEGGDQAVDQLVQNSRDQVAGYWDRRWSDRQRTKLGQGGKYTIQYITEKIIRRAVERCGLTIENGHAPNYYLCMHWPTDDGVAEEHWWLEVYGYTVEIIPSWHDLKIYSPRSADPGHYSQVRVPLRSLHQRHLNRIHHVLANGQYVATPVGGWS
ncbi:hypothetical protein [Chitinivorax sp. B]|uniref:hypothetical protein n=1 Tax=Chitinivorax sp. B TaxID=2502235 RepID=UPI0010F73C7A|nr:hypothetical protein [Chitinivorax sp. B]